MPFYTLMLDRFVNGDPSNDDANKTAWEHDLTGTQLRHGGDIKGLQDSLDYVAGLGIKGLYLAGSPMINVPWGSDGYSPQDFSLLDRHLGDIAQWRAAVDAIHAAGMYVILDNTMATMGDLVGWQGYDNVTAPFEYGEHDAYWKTDTRYLDFDISNKMLDKCDYPRWYNDSGDQVFNNGTQHLIGCRDSDFDQYGDIDAFSFYPEYQRQLSKFSSVQDRLREWKPSVRERIQNFACMEIAMLDIDGFRMDKGAQITVDSQADFAQYVRNCARQYNKNNFQIVGELTAGNGLNPIYIGRGKLETMQLEDPTLVVGGSYKTLNDSLFIRDQGNAALDGAMFDYPTWRALTRFLGLSGELAATYDPPVDLVSPVSFFTQAIWSYIFVPSLSLDDFYVNQFKLSMVDRWPPQYLQMSFSVIMSEITTNRS